MGKHVTFDYSLADKFIREDEVELMMASVHAARETLESKSGAGNDFLGWIDLPEDYDKAEFERIQAAAKKIQSDSDVLVVIGIGGSYLGARAAIEFLRHCFYNSVDKSVRKTPEIYYAGNNISGTYLAQLIETIGDRDFSVNVISKSGTTTEPAIAFRVMKEILENKYGKEEAAKRIYATTDKAKGALKSLATEEGYETFVVPDDVGGRFSVLTAVGLLPIAASGADITKLMEGAQSMRKLCLETPIEKNDAILYAAVRNLLYRKGKSVEVLANYEYVTFTNGNRTGKLRKSATSTSLLRKQYFPFKQPYKDYPQRLKEMEAFLMNFENGLASIQQFEIRKMSEVELNNAIYDYINL